jgi:hypothetical protein
MKGLRPANLISVKGRGTSAAEMTSRDAAVLLIAIATGASTSYVATATKILMDMPLQLFSRPKLEGFARMRQAMNHKFYNKTAKHTFFEGLEAVFEINPDDPDGHSGEEDQYDVFKDLTRLALSIGMDLEKKGGFALLQTGSRSDAQIFNCYSSWQPKNPEEKSLPNLLTAFDTNASFTLYHFKGEVLFAALKALQEPTKTTRIRKPRAASWGRR